MRTKPRTWVLGLSALSAFWPGIQPSLAEEADAITLQELKNQIQTLTDKLRNLERKQEAEKEETAAETKSAVVVSAGPSGFSIRSADTNFVLRLRGGLQVDGRFYPGPSKVNDTFLLRRVRPIIEGAVYDKFDYRMMFDFASGVSLLGNNNGSVVDAYGNLRLGPEFQLQAGKFKEPVGLERLQSWRNLLFVERGFPTQLLPNRDTGVMIHGELFGDRLNYQLGVFNGAPDGNSNDFDSADPDKDFAARFFAQPFLQSNVKPLRGLGLGLSGTYGKQNRVPRSYSTPGSQRFFAYHSNTVTTLPNILGDGVQSRMSPQGYWYWGPFGLLGEYALSSQKLRQTGGGTGAGQVADLRNSAWQLELSYFLTGEENSYKPISPRQPFALGGKGWGAIELAARVGELDPDDRAMPIFADPKTSAAEAFSWGVGVNWHLNRFFKLSLHYENTELKAASGNEYAGPGQEHVILTRLQATF